MFIRRGKIKLHKEDMQEKRYRQGFTKRKVRIGNSRVHEKNVVLIYLCHRSLKRNKMHFCIVVTHQLLTQISSENFSDIIQ